MTSTTFDTLEYAKKLQGLGFTREQSEGFAQIQREIIEDRLVTKDHLDIRLAELKNDLLRWMVGGFITQSALIIAVLALMR
jgi:hypothetical protein